MKHLAFGKNRLSGSHKTGQSRKYRYAPQISPHQPQKPRLLGTFRGGASIFGCLEDQSQGMLSYRFLPHNGDRETRSTACARHTETFCARQRMSSATRNLYFQSDVTWAVGGSNFGEAATVALGCGRDQDIGTRPCRRSD
jgi:hypothetical protein